MAQSSFAQDNSKAEKKDSTTDVQNVVPAASLQQVGTDKPINTVCPVSGEEIDSKITYTYNGKTYGLCCNKCLKKFKAEPEKYISRMKSDEKPVGGTQEGAK